MAVLGTGTEQGDLLGHAAPKLHKTDHFFREWYKLYPRHVAPDAAQRAFRIILGDRRATFEELIAGVKRYAEHVRARRTEMKYVAHPATWLNRGSWKDKYGSEASQVRSDAWDRAADRFRGRTA
jgi:hypothetical protein